MFGSRFGMGCKKGLGKGSCDQELNGIKRTLATQELVDLATKGLLEKRAVLVDTIGDTTDKHPIKPFRGNYF